MRAISGIFEKHVFLYPAIPRCVTAVETLTKKHETLPDTSFGEPLRPPGAFLRLSRTSCTPVGKRPRPPAVNLSCRQVISALPDPVHITGRLRGICPRHKSDGSGLHILWGCDSGPVARQMAPFPEPCWPASCPASRHSRSLMPRGKEQCRSRQRPRTCSIRT